MLPMLERLAPLPLGSNRGVVSEFPKVQSSWLEPDRSVSLGTNRPHEGRNPLNSNSSKRGGQGVIQGIT